MPRVFAALVLCASLACHPIVEVANAEELPTTCAAPTPEEVLVKVSGLLQPVIAKHTGFPPGREANIRAAFQAVLDSVHSNISNAR